MLAVASAMLTPAINCGKRKIDEMSTIAEEGPSCVNSDDSLSDCSSGTAWNTPMAEAPETPIDQKPTAPNGMRCGSASPAFCSDGQAGISVGRGFAAARTSPRYETGVATALHLEYTAAGRRELMAARHWFGRLAPRAWASWKGVIIHINVYVRVLCCCSHCLSCKVCA